MDTTNNYTKYFTSAVSNINSQNINMAVIYYNDFARHTFAFSQVNTYTG